jgi:adenylate kinase family enzyme
VRDASGAFHITLSGQAAYSFRYDVTFGFYEGVAAVQKGASWFHVREDGSKQYSEDYAWCGNFQESRCPVRTREGRYFHIDHSGKPAYLERHLYAGDYRDGIACVRLSSGFSAHIDRDGQFLNAARFLDLDVFHKGFARARDAGGWMHVNREGRPLYEHRFAEVEPFYNGQAHVLSFDGQRFVVDEAGDEQVRIAVANSSKANETSPHQPILIVVGAPGSGKSTLAQHLHREMGLTFASIDHERRVHGDGTTASEMRAWASFLSQIELGTCAGIEFSGSGPFVAHIKQAIRNAGRAYRVIWVHVPCDMCVERVRGRNMKIPYPFYGETIIETTKELHARLEREIQDECHWASDRVLRIDGRLPANQQMTATIEFLKSSPSNF